MLSLLLGLTSCNNNKNDLYQFLPIVKEYEPEYYVFDRDEISKEELQEMPDLRLVINSENEFPQENLLGIEELKDSNIDFKKYTLLLSYFKLPGVVLGYRYQYAKELETDSIIFFMGFRLDQKIYENPETENLFTYCRSAILVSKIIDDSELIFRWSY